MYEHGVAAEVEWKHCAHLLKCMSVGKVPGEGLSLEGICLGLLG